MTPLRPRRLVHRGRVEAAGFLVESELLGLAAARRRVLDAWRPGAAVERLGSWLLLLPPAPVWTDVPLAPGAPLVKRGGLLLAAPLDPDELEALAAGAGSVVTVRGGTASVHASGERVPEDPATWLDTSAYALLQVESLGTRAAPPAVEAPPPLDVRERLGVAPAAEGAESARAALVAALAGKAPPRPPSRLAALWTWLAAWWKGQAPARAGAGATRSATPGTRALATRPPSLLARALARVLVWMRPQGGGASASGTRPAPRPLPVPSGPRPPSLFERLRDQLGRAAARLLQLTRLDALVGRAQAEYLLKMMEMFERGQLDQALRHAIPLGTGEGEVRPSLGVPKPRADLSLKPTRAGGGTSTAIGVGSDVMDELRRMYRRAADELIRRGRIEEAAFTLAELLGATEEAASLLERHGKLRLAAELAEGRGLPPGQVVRLWFLAGDVPRAVQVARRTGAFADAVLRLERTHREQAQALRVVWAESLAEAGNYGGAVDVLWPDAKLRERTKPWLEALVELGGSAGARALVLLAVVEPAAFPRIRERAVALLEDESREHVRERTAFANALMRQAHTPELGTLARPLARALVRDRALHGEGKGAQELDWVATFSKDGALRTDLPPLPTPSARRRDAGVIPEVELDAHDAGTAPVLDAVPLAKDRVLVALGERGARVLTRDGRTLHHFDVPAHRLVPSSFGNRALALAPRGEATRVAQLDLMERRAEERGEVRVDTFAPDYDGSLWFMAAGDAVFAVDALSQGLKAVWRVDRLGGRVLALARAELSLVFTVDGAPPERWSYELPSLTLRQRTSLEIANLDPLEWRWRIGQSVGRTAVLRAPVPLAQAPGSTVDFFLSFQMSAQEATRFELALPGSGEPRAPVLDGEWLAVPFERPDGVEVLLMDAKGGLAARFLLRGARKVAIRFTHYLLTIADDRGRVLVYDVEQGTVWRDLRV